MLRARVHDGIRVGATVRASRGLVPVTGTSSLALTASGAIRATALIDGTSAFSFAPSATLLGSGILAGSSPLSLSPTGNLENWNPSHLPNCVSFFKSGNYSVNAGTGTWTATRGPNATNSTSPPVAESGTPHFQNYITQNQTLVAPNALNGVAGTNGANERHFLVVFQNDTFTSSDQFYAAYDSDVYTAIVLEGHSPNSNLYYEEWVDSLGSYAKAEVLLTTSGISGSKYVVQGKFASGHLHIKVGSNAWVQGAVFSGGSGINEFTPLVLGSMNGKLLAYGVFSRALSDSESTAVATWGLGL